MSLKDYIQGKRHGKEANQLEREAMNDPFLQDAIEGFDSVQGNHLDIIGQLEKEIDKKKKQKTFFIRYAIFSTAAMLALVLGISVFFRQTEIQTPIAETKTIQKDSDSLKLQQIQQGGAEQQTHKTELAINKEMPVTPAPVNVETKEITESLDAVSENIPMTEESEVIQVVTSAKQSDTNTFVVDALQPADKTIIIRGSSSISTQKPKTIKGRVVDESGEPIIGATVHLKNNKYAGTITDIEGNFTLALPGDKPETLEAQYIGYKSKTFAADSTSTVVRLEPDNLALNEVVVVGYGTRNIFGAKTKSAAGNELSGRMAGVSVKTSEQKPVFATAEFKNYIKSNLTDSICSAGDYKLIATFKINNSGKPTGTKIVSSDCPELENEFLRLTEESPVWTITNRKVTVTIKK